MSIGHTKTSLQTQTATASAVRIFATATMAAVIFTTETRIPVAGVIAVRTTNILMSGTAKEEAGVSLMPTSLETQVNVFKKYCGQYDGNVILRSYCQKPILTRIDILAG